MDTFIDGLFVGAIAVAAVVWLVVT